MYGQASRLLQEMLPQTLDQRNTYNVRNITDLDIPKANTKGAKSRFFPATSREWNDLLEDWFTVYNVNDFKEFKVKTRPKIPTTTL